MKIFGKELPRPFFTAILVGATIVVVLFLALIFTESSNLGHDKEKVFLPKKFDIKRWKAASTSSLYRERKRLDSLLEINSVKPYKAKKLAESIREIETKISKIENDHSEILGYTHPKNLKRNEIGHINAFVNIAFADDDIRNELRKIINKQKAIHDDNDTSVIYTCDVVVYDALDLSLIDPQGIFKITQVHDTNYQKINRRRGNRWDWAISTSTDQKLAQLILKVNAISPGEEREPLDDKQIPIIIEVDNSSVLRRVWIYLLDHPEFILASILLPFVAYFGKRYLERKG